MFKYISKKLITLIAMTFVISLVIFILVNYTGVDPVMQHFTPETFTQEAYDALKIELGLDKSMFERYCIWLNNLLHGELGKSEARGFSIKSALAAKWPATLELSISALIVSSILGIGIGAISAYKQNGIVDYIGRGFAVFGNAIPSYFLALILIQLFAVPEGSVLPIGGRIAPGQSNFFARLPNLVLPTLALAIPMCGSLMRYTRNTMLDMASKEYVKFARSKGIPEWKIYVKHVFRNSLRPIVTVLLSRATLLIGGSVTIDSIFNWPGIGSLLSSAVTSSDSTVVLFSALTSAVVMLLISFGIDIFTALLDPRVRLED